MKKRKKKKPGKHQSTRSQSPQTNIVRIPFRKRKTGELGIFERDYPPAYERNAAIDRIRVIPDPDRSPDDWWLLGEYLVYNGLMDEDDGVVNEGIQALTSGANHPTPSPAFSMFR